MVIATAQAVTPLWTFKLLTATNVSITSTGTIIIKYQVTNQSLRPRMMVILIARAVLGKGVVQFALLVGKI